MKKVIFKQALLVGGIVLAVAAPSFAQSTVTFTLSPSGGGNYQGVEIDTQGESLDAAAGSYQATLGGNAVNVFCVDPNDDINWGTSYQADDSEVINAGVGSPVLNTVNGDTYYNGGLASSLTTADMYKVANSTPTGLNAQEQADEVGYLAYEGLSASNASSTTEAAYQLAIWSVIDNGPTDASTEFTYTDSAIQSAVNADITAAIQNYNAGDNNFNGVSWVQAPVTVTNNGNTITHTQDFVYLNGSPEVPSNPFSGGPQATPEPSIVAFLCSLAVALGIMIFLKRRVATNS